MWRNSHMNIKEWGIATHIGIAASISYEIITRWSKTKTQISFIQFLLRERAAVGFLCCYFMVTSLIILCWQFSNEVMMKDKSSYFKVQPASVLSLSFRFSTQHWKALFLPFGLMFCLEFQLCSTARPKMLYENREALKHTIKQWNLSAKRSRLHVCMLVMTFRSFN